MSPDNSSKRPRVLIIGAGIGGLTLAQALRRAEVPYDVFERDKSVDSRIQGWAIALHSFLDDLLQSVPASLPPLDDVNHLLPLPHNPELCFYVGSKKLRVEGGGSHRIIRANRLKLRKWLATDSNVHWNKHMTSFQQTEESVTVTFSDGTSVTGDVLVGADGVNSIVRSHIPKFTTHPQRMPITTIVGEPTLANSDFTSQLDLAKSAYVVMGDNFHLFVGLNAVAPDGASAKYYWVLNKYDAQAEKGPTVIDELSQQGLLDVALETCSGFDPRFTLILRKSKAEYILQPSLVMKDIEIDSLPLGRVTLLGDAAHAMAPFRGEGGAHAMKDALNLARVLAKANTDRLPEALKEYEEEMLPRGRDAVEKSRAAFTVQKSSQSMKAWGETPELSTY